ncbi:glycoside hydrolase N-terminal domain-containing protein [Lysinimonas soli]|uniref:Glycoside hydrolase N-terminal domain-containing protein n=1 Tax=Lysinimonas soli TaxID=1074233 RepID=A0ABW0NSF4_9MICO
MTRILRWEDQPNRWIEGSPIGNGRLGAMVLGTVEVLHLQINDGTVWSGTPDSWRAELDALVAAGAGPEALERVRVAVREGRLDDAERLLMGFEGTYSQEFLPYLDLRVRMRFAGSTPAYRGRTLDLLEAVYDDIVENDLVRVERRAWASRPDQAVHVEIRAEGAAVDIEIDLTTRLRTVDRRADRDGLVLLVEIPVDGAPFHESQVEPMRWRGDRKRPGHPADGTDDAWGPVAAAAVAVETDGEVVVRDGRVVIGRAHVIRLAVASSTAAEDWFSGAPGLDRAAHGRRAVERAQAALSRDGGTALRRHVDDVRPLLAAAALRFEGTPEEVVVDRLDADPVDAIAVPALFQYGRYLLVAASRPGGPAVNLQGLWNDDLRPPWSSNYTTNINVQMHYWGADPTGLGDTVEPLLHLLEVMAATGSEAARRLYGVDGWVGHHNTDLWGWPLPVGMGHGDPAWAIWMTGGTWLVTHLMEHHRFTLDDAWLGSRAWPVLRGAAAFALDWLLDEGGPWLVTNPATSPENHFVHGDGAAALDRATAIDRAVISQVLHDTIEAGGILGLDDDIIGRARAALARIEPDAVGGDGRIREWHVDRADPDPAHGHFSALVGLYPLGRIDVDARPDLAAAASAFVSSRSHPAEGWPWVWSIALRARLRDGEAAERIMHTTFRPAEPDPDLRGADHWAWGGLVPTLLRAHSPFQVDVSLGFPAAIAEILLQSHAGEVHLLPALPPAWPPGEVVGLRARGGLIVDAEWAHGRLRRASLARIAGSGTVVVRFGDTRVTIDLAAGARVELDEQLRLVASGG